MDHHESQTLKTSATRAETPQTENPVEQPATPDNQALTIEPLFCPADAADPFDTVEWELRTAAIKGEGGMVMAQNPDSTEHDGMPRSAIATGLVDYELPPAEMPAQLIAYVDHAFEKRDIIECCG